VADDRALAGLGDAAAVKKDATPECIPCHVVGFRQAGGFQTDLRTPHLVNVQCENCHGMGTEHASDWLSQHKVDEAPAAPATTRSATPSSTSPPSSR
jgi:hypothetical protein